MAWKNPFDMFWTSSVEPRLFLLYFLVQLGMGLPWTALSLMFVKDLVIIDSSHNKQKLTMDEINMYYAYISIPWGLKVASYIKM